MVFFSAVRDRFLLLFFEGCKIWDYRGGLLWGVDLFFLTMAFFAVAMICLYCMSERVLLFGLGVVCKKGRMNGRLGGRLWVA